MPPALARRYVALPASTQLYEFVLLLVLVYTLHKWIRSTARPGMVMIGYFYGYPLIRFPLEFIRADNLIEPHTFGLSVGQIACVVMIAAAIVGHALLTRRLIEPPAAEPTTARQLPELRHPGDAPSHFARLRCR